MEGLEANLEASFGDGIQSGEMAITMKTSVEKLVSKILGEKLAKDRATKLTWSTTDKRLPKDKMIGTEGLNLRREYIVLGRKEKIFIQNCKIYLANGKQISIEDVPDVIRAAVIESYENHKRQALAADDALCPYCLEIGMSFTAASHQQYADHMLKNHADVLLKKLHADKPPVAEEVVPEPVAESRYEPKVEAAPQPVEVKTWENLPPETGVFLCHCGFTAVDSPGLKRHQTRKHKRA